MNEVPETGVVPTSPPTFTAIAPSIKVSTTSKPENTNEGIIGKPPIQKINPITTPAINIMIYVPPIAE